MYKYYIAYQFSHGFGSCEVTRENKLDSFEEIRKLTDAICKDIQKENPQARSIIILNVLLLN